MEHLKTTKRKPSVQVVIELPLRKRKLLRVATLRKPQISRLLLLPPELRYIIWGYALAFDTPREPLDSKDYFPFEHTPYQFYDDDKEGHYNSWLCDQQAKLFRDAHKLSMVSWQCYADVADEAILCRSNTFSTRCLLGECTVMEHPVRALKPSFIAAISSFRHQIRLDNNSDLSEDLALLLAKMTQQGPLKHLDLNLLFSVGRNHSTNFFDTLDDVYFELKAYLALHEIQRLKSFDLKVYFWQKEESADDGEAEAEKAETL